MKSDGVKEALSRAEKLAGVVRDNAAESERLGRLAPMVVQALREANLFAMFVPQNLGGIGLTIPEGVLVLERVASFDASAGWTLAILADGALFARFFPPAAIEAVGDGRAGLIASSFNPATVRAERMNGGFSFSGTATYLSGSAHAEWIMATAVVTDGGKPVFQDGRIEIRAGLFPLDQASTLDSWNVTGMRATGSSDFTFERVMVEAGWTFEPLRPQVPKSDVFGAIPLWAQVGGALAACPVGAARNMVDRFVELAAVKVPAGGMRAAKGGNASRLAERGPAQMALGEAYGLTEAAHAVLTQSVALVWERGLADGPFDDRFLAQHRLGTVTAVRLAARAVDLLHDAAGMTAVDTDSVLERCWRDVHTMTQHMILSPARFEIGGRVLLGLDPGAPVI